MTNVRRFEGYAWALAAPAVCTAAGFAMRPRFDLVNVAMVYLMAVVFVSLRYPRGPAIATAIVSVAAFDFLFVPPAGTFTVEDAQYIVTFLMMLTVALVISKLVERARRQAVEQAGIALVADTERVRSALLASISHDLRSPLAVVAGASSTLFERGDRLAADERLSLTRSIYEQATDLSERVTKILQMTRLDAAGVQVQRDWSDAGEIVAAALARVGERLAAHRVIVELPDDLPLLRVDAALVDQALGNLLENAAKHTRAGTVVRVRAKLADGMFVYTIEDYGGDPDARDVARVMAALSERPLDAKDAASGLGLAICRAVAKLHGGRAWAERVASGGMALHLTLPLEPVPPVPLERER